MLDWTPAPRPRRRARTQDPRRVPFDPMCGFLGWISLDGAPLPAARLNAALPLLSHRGPEHSGVWQGDGCWLGHRRLSILDLSEGGNQPMVCRDDRYVMVYNGEFYNYREHAPLLESKGYPLRSTGDTAVLLGLYSLFGEKALDYVNGMFSMAVWDTRERSLFLARDRMGKKPLYYALDGRRVCFASEMKALAPLLDRRILDGAAVDAYFALGYVPAPRSIYSEVRKLEASTCLSISGGSERKRRYWSPAASNKEPVTDEEVVDTLRDSIRLRFVSDVPVGMLLSGGIDSSLLASLAAEDLGESFKAFCVAAGEAAFDERPFAAEVAEHCGIELATGSIKDEVEEQIERVFPFLDEPFADASALPTFAVCELASANGKVVLSGEGGDELFGGYDKYHRFLAARSFRRVPSLLRRLLSRPGADVDEERPSLLRSLTRAARHSFSDDVECAAAFCSPLSGKRKSSLFSGPFRREFSIPNADYFRQHADEALEPFSLQRLMDIDRKTYLADGLLFKADRMSMANSLEVRCPFLDHRLVELSRRLGEHRLIRGRTTKAVLRSIASKRLPPRIARRPKRGFGAPLALWFRERLVPLFRETVRPESGLSDVLDYQEIDRRLSTHREGKRDLGGELWSILAFHLWWRRFGKGASPAV